MPRFAVLIAFILLIMAAAAQASETSVRFTDRAGHCWQRWLITETQNERTLLLVVENPVGIVTGVSQHFVYRHSFARDSREFSSKLAYFHDLQDHPEPTFNARAVHQPIWVLKQDHWTLDDERRYTSWIQNTVTENFLRGAGINVDCADLSLTLRWVYAHDHGLPAANTLSGAGGLFGQWSGTTAWDLLPTNSDWHQDARFKAALRYLLNSAYTHTILNDLYPIEISREYVTPGAIRLTITDVESGHTQIIHRIGHDANLCPDGQCVSVFYGDTPSSETIYDDVAWLLNLKHGKGGFLRWRWPVKVGVAWSLTPAAAMVGYSLEQFSHPSFTTDQFETYINTQLFWSTTITDRATTLGYSLIQSLKTRVQITALGDAFCAQTDCGPQSPAYDAYSTPARDNRYTETRARFIDLVANDAVDTSADEYRALLAKARLPIFSGGGLTYSNYIFDDGGLNERLSPDPSRVFADRWGLNDATPAQNQWASESLWETLWSYRESQVQAARETSTVDRTLRSVRQTLRSQVSQLDMATRSQLMSYTALESTAETGQSFCAQTPSGRCLISDFIYSSSPAVDRMSSAAKDDLADRFGL